LVVYTSISNFDQTMQDPRCRGDTKKHISSYCVANISRTINNKSKLGTKKQRIPTEIMMAAHSCDYPSNLPATQALERLSHMPSREYITSKKITSTIPRNKKSSAFDLSDLVSASQPVEESIAFPMIAWDSDEGDSDADDRESCAPSSLTCDDEDQERLSRSESMSSLGKRGRDGGTGMVRSKSQKVNLTSLAGGSASEAPRRTGSCFEFNTPSSAGSFPVPFLDQSQRSSRRPAFLTPFAA